MRKISSILFQFTLFGLTLTGLNTQAQNLLIQSQIGNLPDTVTYGTTSTFTINVKNIDTAPYTGNISVYMGLDSNMQMPPIDSSSVSVTNLASNDSVFMSFVVTFDSIWGANGQHFRPGNNIVVVWPKSSNLNGTVSKDVYVAVTLYADNKELVLPEHFPYPNPTNGQLFISEGIHNNELKLYNNFGKSYPVIMSGNGKIDVSELTSGIYYLHILQNGKVRVYKIVKN